MQRLWEWKGVCSGSQGSEGFPEAFEFSRLSRVSGARGRAREAHFGAHPLGTAWGEQWRSPGAGSAPGQVYQPVPGFRAPVPAPASKAAAGSGPDADFVPLPKVGAREVWLTLLAPRA